MPCLRDEDPLRAIYRADQSAVIREPHLESRLAKYGELAAVGEPAADKRSKQDANAEGKSAPTSANEYAGSSGTQDDAGVGRRNGLLAFIDYARFDGIAKVNLRVVETTVSPAEA